MQSEKLFLVVIGILIALYINNWNENRKLQKAKTEYYKQLLEELNLDIKEIDPKLKRIEQSISSYHAYLANFETPNLPLDSKIAVIESDSAAFQHYLSLVDTTFGFYGYLKLAEFMFMDTVTDQQIQEYMDVYGSKLGWLYVTHQLPENDVVNLSLIERFLKVRPDPFSVFALRK